MGSFSIVSSCALVCYILLFSIFFASKKNKIIKAFLCVIAFLIVWTGGSLLMRLQAFPGVALWYHVSLVGIWLSCFALIRFINVFVGQKTRPVEIVMFVIAVIMLAVNCFTNLFLGPPTPVETNGKAVFIYTMTTGTYVMYAYMFVVAGYALVRTARCFTSNAVTRRQLVPLLFGSIIMFAGQIVIMIPSAAGIPLDIASGVIYAICLFYALYRRRLFTLTLAFSRRTYCLVTAGILLLLSIRHAANLQKLIASFGGFAAENSAAIMIVIGILFAVLLYVVIKELSEFLFLADERDRSVALKAFNVEVSRSLHVDVICQQLCNLLRTAFSGLSGITVAVADSKGDLRISADTNALTKGQLIFAKDNPAVQWCISHPDGGRISDFRYSLEYKSMWESEKQRISEMNTDYIFPLLDAGELIGVVLLTCKDHFRSPHSEDINFISSANTVASIAIKNSRMYEKACHDARTDDLTGLLNRKYFMEELNQCIEKDPYGILTLAIINLDDFKLYNQLYGAAEGDQALRRVANILSRNAGENTIVARYSGKEFALLMPGREPSSAFRLAESLRLQIYNMNRVEEASEYSGSMSILTCSIGICSIPFGATTAKQLLDNVDMTVYQVKKSGKNGVKVYSVDPDNIGADLPVAGKNHEEAYSEFAQTLYALTATIDTKDHYTFTHSNNVAYYAVQLATALGLNKETVEIIRQAALLHDIGKIGIPENILNKPSRLTNEEYEIIKKHPENAVAIIRHLPNLDYLIPAVISHHERWDGKGYPRRIGGEDIPLSGRILCIADCFDAMTGRRCYQDGRDVESALQDLEVNAGKQFDPALAKLFVQKFREGFIQLQVRPYQENSTT